MKIFSHPALLALGLPLLFAPLSLCAASYEQLLAQLRQAPQYSQWQWQQQRADALAEQAAARANPSLSLQADDIYGSSPYRNTGSAEYSWQLSQPLDVWGERTARAQAAQASARVASVDADIGRWQLAAELATRYAALELAQQQLGLTEQMVASVEADLQAVRLAVSAGREAELYALQAESELAQQRVVLPGLRAQTQVAEANLLALLPAGVAITPLTGSLLNRELSAPAVASPQFMARFEAARERAQQQLAQTRAASRPQFTFTVGGTRYAAEDADALMLGVEMTLPVFDRHQGALRAAAADLVLADLSLEAARREQQAREVTVMAEATAARLQLQELVGMVGKTERAYAMVRQGYRAGRLNALALREARRQWLSVKNQLLEAQMAQVQAEIAQALLQGREPFISEVLP